MKLTFLGATHEVTGSCYYLEACGKRLLIDCGMEQGKDWFVNQPIPVAPGEVDMVLLTHAHIDHSGKLPLLVKQGFKGQIFSTEGTQQLCDIMLRDSAHIQEFEAEWKNRKAERAGKPEQEPMYTTEDAMAAMRCFVGIPYNEIKYIDDGIRIRFIDAGHLLGSASVEVWLTEDGQERHLIFSGDIGNTDQPLIADPVYPEEADYVIMESTYGDRSHEKPADYVTELAQVLQTTFDKGGNVVIPSFAVGRTQEMLYFIRQIKEEKLVKGHDGFEVWVDSPLAVEATSIFLKRMYYDFDNEAKELLDKGINPISFDGLKLSVTSEESKLLNTNPNCKVILSASGMCEAGRIRHHLKHNLWREESTILFVGYQGEGTLGRMLLDGADKVKLFGEEVQVKARVLQLPGISGHADNNGLLRWIGNIKEKPRKVFVTHGEDSVCTLFAGRLRDELGLNAYAPYSGTVYDLLNDCLLYEAEPQPIVKEETQVSGRTDKDREKNRNKVTKEYEALLEAGNRLMQVIAHNMGGANADLKRFAKDLDKLARKWER